MSTVELAVGILDTQAAFVEAAEAQGTKVDVPEPVDNLLEANVLSDADGGHVHPAAIPANAAVSADVADFESIGILEGRQAGRHRARRRRVAGGRGLLVEGLMGALVVELGPKEIEAALLEPTR